MGCTPSKPSRQRRHPGSRSERESVELTTQPTSSRRPTLPHATTPFNSPRAGATSPSADTEPFPSLNPTTATTNSTAHASLDTIPEGGEHPPMPPTPRMTPAMPATRTTTSQAERDVIAPWEAEGQGSEGQGSGGQGPAGGQGQPTTVPSSRPVNQEGLRPVSAAWGVHEA